MVDPSASDVSAARPARRAARTRRAEMRLSEEEYAALEAKAQEAGITLSALLRDHFGKVQVRDRETERRRLALLNRINANLNMIARYCNIHKDGADAVSIMAHLVAVEREIGRLLMRQEQS